MIRALVGLAVAMGLSGCTTREMKPAEVEMDRVEAALALNPCVGTVDSWQRSYFYHPKYFGEEVEDAKREGREPRSSGHIRTLIGFDLRQGGANVAGRISLGAPPSDASTPAQTGQRRALGSFDVRDGAMKMASCDSMPR